MRSCSFFHFTACVGEVEEFAENVARLDVLDLDQVAQVLLQALPSLLSHHILLLACDEVVDICKEVAGRRVLNRRESVDEHLNK